MTFTAETAEQAECIARRLRALYAADGYEVEIVAPLFAGDTYRVNVN